MNYHAQPFALSEGELKELIEFAQKSGLDQIGRMAAELVALRAAYVTLSTRHAKLLAELDKLIAELDKKPTAEKVYGEELDTITGRY